MLKQLPTIEFKAPFNCIVALAHTLSLCACTGGTISFNTERAEVNIDENTHGVFWHAKAQAQGDVKNIAYKISGADAALFAINSANGALSFKTPADFETPADNDNNNIYEIDIEAEAANNTAKQHVLISIKDVSKPVISLEKPKPNENVGTDKLGSIETETAVRFYDAESNAPIKEGSVTLNTSALARDTADPQVWNGKITVPEGNLDVRVSGFLADKTRLSITSKLLNKPYAANPSYLGIFSGAYIVFFDPQKNRIAKLGLKNNFWSKYWEDPRLESFYPIYAWNSGKEIIYAIKNDTNKLKALNISGGIPELFSAGCLSNALGLAYDKTNSRVIALTQDFDSGSQVYRAQAVATSNEQGRAFVDQQTDSEAPCTPAITQNVFEAPLSAAPGTFKHFNYYEANNTFIVADERFSDGIKKTHIQGFNKAGSKQFETILGADISNLAINQTAGLMYVVENHSSGEGKIKEIEIKSGVIRDIDIPSHAVTLGAYTNIQIDRFKNILYIGDDVSDSIFAVDLATQLISDLNIAPARPGPEPVSD
ncbi:MAG: cadherin repeat domain-containing protein [Marinagarivorans sp.]